jgi:hypothetical protein
MPRWVKVSGIIVAVLILLIVVLLLSGGHGPRRHLSGGTGGHARSSVTASLTLSGGGLGGLHAVWG